MTSHSNSPDLLINHEPDDSHVVYTAEYKGKEYRVPVPVHLQDRLYAIQSYCRGYLRAAGVRRWEASDD